ncbi:YjfB family protein [Aromatoleum bremense]|uniref:Motility protein n=1 Tax=Aromatoleum bremense TaxID=76115 RepID=A0ABX1NRQ2_9RHOO|nr:YjfB family protein [Aromatoleum bremense]NMG14644.1 putative motility protein [Aromatoleum bremense]QTQ30510.1 putative motility protein [Aromatoleum bremense]
MNVATIAAAASANSAATVQAQASLLVLKKAMDLQQSGAAQLLQALPQPAVAPIPGATVGGSIDLFV